MVLSCLDELEQGRHQLILVLLLTLFSTRSGLELAHVREPWWQCDAMEP